MYMKLCALSLAAWLIASPVAAQSQSAPSAPTGELPVSLDRVRQGLARPSTLKNLDLKPDFVIRVEEREHIQAILSKLEVTNGPIPGGGLYGYEQQQMLANKTDRPLQQPYAAYSGGELITLAIEGLAQKYLGSKIASSITNAQRSGAERAARGEVAQAIAEYCDAQPDGGRSLHLCTDVLDR